MRITEEMFSGLRISGKSQQKTEFLTREARQQLEASGQDAPRMTDDSGAPLTGVNVLVDDEVFGDETDTVLQVLVPDSALKGLDLKNHAYEVVRFTDLEINTYISGPREARRLGISMTASGIDLPKSTASSTSTSAKAS